MSDSSKTRVDLSDSKVFEKIFKEYYRPMFLFAEAYVMDSQKAEDIVQEIFLKLLKNKVVITTSVKSYLFRAVKNNALDYLKNYNVEDNFDYHLFDSCFYSGDIDLNADLEESVKNAIDNLPEKCSEILKMSLYQSYSYKEIADELDISVNTVKTQIKRAHKFLRDELKEVKVNLFAYFFLKKNDCNLFEINS